MVVAALRGGLRRSVRKSGNLAHGGRGQSVLCVATVSGEVAVAILRGRAMAAPFCGGRLRWKPDCEGWVEG